MSSDDYNIQHFPDHGTWQINIVTSCFANYGAMYCTCMYNNIWLPFWYSLILDIISSAGSIPGWAKPKSILLVFVDFSAKQAGVKNNSKDWLAWSHIMCQDWTTCLPVDCYELTLWKIHLSLLVKYKTNIIISSSKSNLWSPWYTCT